MDHKADLAILVIVPESREAVNAVFGPPVHFERHAGQDWHIWEVETEDGGRLTVVVDESADRGDVPAQEAAALILDVWRPRYLLLADIGGGFRGRDGLGIGDLVVASGLEYYSLVKEIDGGVEPRTFAIAEPARGPRKDIGRLGDRVPNWLDGVGVERPAAVSAEGPKILPGQIIVGERLLADPDSPTVAELAGRYPKALAVDMESVGVARAVWGAQQQENFTQLAVLRGISDYVDAMDLDNQETRDAVKPFAAAVAIAASHSYIRTLPSDESVLSRAGEPPRRRAPSVTDAGVDDYLGKLRSTLASRPPLADQPFRLPLRSTDVRAEDSVTPAPPQGQADPDRPADVERSELLDIVEHDKLVVVVGKGGAGKSVLMDAMARQLAAADDPITIRIDLKTGWSPAWADAMPDAPFGDQLDLAMDALLNAASPGLNVGDLSRFAEAASGVVILVDALNEVPPDVAGRIRLTLGQYVRQHPRARALATDRRIELDYRELRWTALELPMLNPEEARRVIDAGFGKGVYDRQPEARRDILRIPFFIDRALSQGTVDFNSRAELVARYLQDGGLEEDDLEVTSEVAFEILMRGETVISADDRRRLAEHGVLEKLENGGFVVDGPSGLVFSHQLIHQYLAGRRLASDPDLWTADVMDRVTSFTASLDGVGMAVKSIDNIDGRDQFLHLVHDWNWRAAVVALSEARTGERSVSEATEQAVLAMAAEKRFDPVEGTRNRISGLLKTVDGATAKRFGEVEEAELREEIGRIEHPDIEWWAEWRQIFLLDDADELCGEKMVACIASEMPLIGWMLANALRRIEPTDEVSRLVRMVYRTRTGRSSENRAIRWRVLHTLGAWPSDDNADLLVEALGDEHIWCRYGAVRSLVEMAARPVDHDLRGRIIGRLSATWAALDPEPLSQIAWAARYSAADTEWPGAIRPLIEDVRNAQRDEERDRWDRRVAEFDRYAERHNGTGGR